MTWIHKLLGRCPGCRRYFHWPKRRRLNTAYCDDEKNYHCSCRECYDAIVEYYDERWEDYYAG